MSVTLPFYSYTQSELTLVDKGGFVESALGGATQRVNRPGSRYRLQATVPALDPREGSAFIAALESGREAGAIARVPTLGQATGGGGAIVSAANQTGSVLALTNATPGWIIAAGAFLSVATAGRSYLYRAATPAQVSATGAVSVALTTMLRKSPASGSIVQFDAPVIEGFVIEFSPFTLPRERLVTVTFTIEEAG